MLTRETVTGEAVFILKSLKENGRLGRSNRLPDVKSSLEPSVSLDFDRYFLFLRKFHYISMEAREANLRLTDQGEKVVEGEGRDRFLGEVGDFFAEALLGGGDQTDGVGIHLGEEAENVNLAEDLPIGTGEINLDEVDDEIEDTEHTEHGAPLPPPIAAMLQTPPPVSPPEARSVPQPPTALPPLGSPMASSFSAPAVAASTSASAVSANSAKGTELDLRYTKFDPIGTGPLGGVHKGRHNALGQDVAIKELKDIFGYFTFLQRGEVVKRLKKELCAQAVVRHPSIVAILDQNTDVARPYFVMEKLESSLREKLDAGGGKGVGVPVALRTFLQLSYALRYAHSTGLMHHNLKPENVLFDSFGNAKLGDFGLGRVIEVDPSKNMPQVFVGTGGMVYMAPELLSRSKDVGPSADVYGLGILLYEMLTGQIPGRRSPLPSEVNSEAPAKLDEVFDKMSHDRREQRYADIDAMLEDFYAAFPDGEYLVKGDLILSSK